MARRRTQRLAADDSTLYYEPGEEPTRVRYIFLMRELIASAREEETYLTALGLSATRTPWQWYGHDEECECVRCAPYRLLSHRTRWLKVKCERLRMAIEVE